MAVRVGEGGSSPLIPDIAGLSAAIRAELSAGELSEPLNVLTSGLNEDLAREPNIEDWLTRLRSLAVIAGASTVRGLTAANIEALERAVTAAIRARAMVDLPVERGAYDSLATWVGAMERAYPLAIYTTNYDLLVEQSLERHGVAYFDGFVGSFAPFLDTRAMEDDELPRRWARLWKLHGSINWTYEADGSVARRAAPMHDSRYLIHPSHLKYDESRRMPYLAMHDRLRALFKEPSATLITIGYSFRDEHINALIIEGLHGNSSSVAFALLHGSLSDYAEAPRLASRCANLTLLAADAGVVGTQCASWLGAETDTPVTCALGDFAVFAEMLAHLSGIGAGNDDATR